MSSLFAGMGALELVMRMRMVRAGLPTGSEVAARFLYEDEMSSEKSLLLNVSIGDADTAGQLIRASIHAFRYLQTDPEQEAVAFLMPPAPQFN